MGNEEDKKEGLLKRNQLDEEQEKDVIEDSEEEEDEDEDGEDDDHDDNIKDDILRPASTRSKIVVNLKEVYGADEKRKRQFGDKDLV